PPPLELSSELDGEGNHVVSSSFERTTQECLILMESTGETLPRPSSLPDGRGQRLPFRFTSGDSRTDLHLFSPMTRSPSVAEFTGTIIRETGHDTLDFLELLSLRIHENIRNV